MLPAPPPPDEPYDSFLVRMSRAKRVSTSSAPQPAAPAAPLPELVTLPTTLPYHQHGPVPAGASSSRPWSYYCGLFPQLRGRTAPSSATANDASFVGSDDLFLPPCVWPDIFLAMPLIGYRTSGTCTGPSLVRPAFWTAHPSSSCCCPNSCP